jgi:hypothetical protein
MRTETDIEAMLDAMHHALVTADFAGLQKLTPNLEAALTRLTPEKGRHQMAQLRSKAKRNAAAALAAGKGVRAALQRLAEVRENAAGLMTYDEKGKRPGKGGCNELSRRL